MIVIPRRKTVMKIMYISSVNRHPLYFIILIWYFNVYFFISHRYFFSVFQEILFLFLLCNLRVFSLPHVLIYNKSQCTI